MFVTVASCTGWLSPVGESGQGKPVVQFFQCEKLIICLQDIRYKIEGVDIKF